MNLNLSILFVLISLSISTVFVTITFILPNWLQTKDDSAHNYGIWHVCTSNGIKCYRWYDNGQTFASFSLSDNFKAFQAMEAVLLAFTVTPFFLLIGNFNVCPRMSLLVFLSALFILLAASSGTIGLVLFGVRIYDPSVHYLGWCFWMSVAATALNTISVILIAIFIGRANFSDPYLLGSSTSLADKPKRHKRRRREKLTDRFSDDIERTPTPPSAPPPSFYPSTFLAQPRPGAVQHQQPHRPNSKSTSSDEVTIDTPIKANMSLYNNHFHYHSEYDIGDYKASYEKNTTPSTQQRSHKQHYHKKKNRSLSRNRLSAIHVNDSFGANYTEERFQPGYSSEPESIKYSLERSWLANLTGGDSLATATNTGYDANYYFRRKDYNRLNNSNHRA